MSDSNVILKGDEGVEVSCRLLHLTRNVAVFEAAGLMTDLRGSKVLEGFEVHAGGRDIFKGRAVVRGHISSGPSQMCEVSLGEGGWNDIVSGVSQSSAADWGERFQAFMEGWQRHHLVLPKFRSVVADMQCFLEDLRLWADFVELEIRSKPGEAPEERERKAIEQLVPPVVHVIDSFIERLEAITSHLEGEAEIVHRMYLRRCLHPLLLASPFANRTYTKPLGYAGDYEVVDMMLRSPHEGKTLFAKLINCWLLCQAPAEAHRKRVAYLVDKLVEETVRVRALGRRAEVFNLGCGPADEVRQFLRHQPVSDHTRLTLLDFNEETIEQLRAKLRDIQVRHRPKAVVRFIRKSVQEVLKDSVRARNREAGPGHDLIYCAGLFDYLTDPICQRLMNIFYEMLMPGGLLVATNVSDALNETRPFRYSMEYILDWHLIYRDGNEFRRLAPELAPADAVRVIQDDGPGANVFIEVRKPQQH